MKRGYTIIIMNTHRHHLKIILNLEAVTCPGVWLCSHGFLEVTVKVLGYYFRSGAMEPYFPLLCHDQFKMEGYFKNIQTMVSLIDIFSKERLEITLWQNSRRMAYYDGVLMDLLQNETPKMQCRHTNTRKLLMKTTPAFPGIIAPQLELTTQLFTKDTILNLYNAPELLRKCIKRPRDCFIQLKYQKPCKVQTSRPEDTINTEIKTRRQRAVCHARNAKRIMKTTSIKSFYINEHGCRDSIVSSSDSNNNHTSVGICEIDHDNIEKQIDDHTHEQFCELCRLYKEVFLM